MTVSPATVVELAATVDAGLPFVKCTYNLEGDGPLVLSCYDTISALNMAARQAHYPNLDAITGLIAARKEVYTAWNSILLPPSIYEYEASSRSVQSSKVIFTFSLE